MRTGRQIRVLMLGWEFPPRFAGGLGKACQGLAQAMAKLGAQIYFVLPSFPKKLVEPQLEVLGAKECMVEAGWDIEKELASASAAASSSIGDSSLSLSPGGLSSEGGISFARSDAQLFPYGVAPAGPIPESIIRIFESEANMEPFIDRSEGRSAGLSPSSRVSPESKKVHPIAQEIPQAQASPESQEPERSIPASEIYGKNLWAEVERFVITVRHLSETHEVDVIHAHDWMTFPAAFEFHRMTGAPVYLHVHATEYDRSGENLNHEIFRIERNGFRKAHHIFAVSRYTAGIIERLYGIPAKKISVVYNAPDSDFNLPPPLYSDDTCLLGEGSGPRVRPQIVFLGRLTFQKGPDHFLKAAALVSRAHPRARFILCGTGDMMDKLRTQAYELGIEERVHFAGFIEPAGIDEVLRCSKVLVMPSVSEPFGLVALEAIRCGIPVILSKQSGVKEVLQRALQVDFWDHDRLADQMLAALRLPDLSKQLVEEGMAEIQQLSWEKSARRVLDLYRRNLTSTFAQVIGGAHGH